MKRNTKIVNTFATTLKWKIVFFKNPMYKIILIAQTSLPNR